MGDSFNASRITPRGFFFTALCGTNAAVLKTAAFVCIGIAAFPNPVGYQNLDIPQGYALATPTFYKVGGGAVSIQDIIPSANAPDGKDGINFVKFQLLDANSEVKDLKTYYWYNCTKTPKKGEPYDLKGWYETMAAGKETPLSTLEIPAGCGLYMQCPAEGVSIRFKGF